MSKTATIETEDAILYDEDLSGHYVNEKDAVKNLVMAVVLQAVLDYRRAILASINKRKDGTYYIEKNADMIECENFFNDVDYPLYKVLPDRVLRFKMASDAIDKKSLSYHNKKVFACPSCGGQVYARTTKHMSKINRTGTVDHYLVSCNSCGLKTYLD